MLKRGDIIQYIGNPAYPEAHQGYKGSIGIVLHDVGPGHAVVFAWPRSDDGNFDDTSDIQWVAALGGIEKRHHRIHTADIKVLGHVEE